MKIIQFFKNLLTGLFTSIRRFPVSIGICVTVTTLAVYLLNNNNVIQKELMECITEIMLTLALGIPITLSLKLIFERFLVVKFVIKIIAFAVVFGFLLFYYFYLIQFDQIVPIIRYLAVSIFFYLSFLVIPYFFRREEFEMYIIKVFSRVLVSSIFSGILLAGLEAIVFSVDKLFEAHFDERIYGDIALCVAGIFAPTFFLAGVPQVEDSFTRDKYPNPFRILLSFIVMPLLSIYTSILYVYFAKIILFHQWPVGLVSHLVVWFAMVGTAVVFLVSPIQGQFTWVRIFSFWYTKLVLPLIFMMFVAMWIRINAYGITEGRYYVLLMGVWITGVMIYQSFAKKPRNIVMPISMGLIAVLSVVGPWSSSSVSTQSQNHRLEKILIKNGMQSEDSIVKAKGNVPKEDQIQIAAIVNYFERTSRLKEARGLPKGFEINKFKETFGFDYHPWETTDGTSRPYFSIFADVKNTPVSISGYDYFYDFSGYGVANTDTKGLHAEYNREQTELIITRDGKILYQKKMSQMGDILYDKYGNQPEKPLTVSQTTLEDGNEEIDLKFIFINIGGSVENGKVKYSNFDFYLMIQLKQKIN